MKNLAYAIKENINLFALEKYNDYKTLQEFNKICGYEPCKYSDPIIKKRYMSFKNWTVIRKAEFLVNKYKNETFKIINDFYAKMTTIFLIKRYFNSMIRTSKCPLLIDNYFLKWKLMSINENCVINLSDEKNFELYNTIFYVKKYVNCEPDFLEKLTHTIFMIQFLRDIVRVLHD